MSADLRKIRLPFFLTLLAAAATAGTVFIACDDTDPSPIGVHFDDASVEPDTAPPPEQEAGDDGGTEGGDEAGDDGGTDAESDADAADAREDG